MIFNFLFLFITSFFITSLISFLTLKSFLTFKNYILILCILSFVYFILFERFEAFYFYFLIFIFYILVIQSIIDILTFNVYSIFNYLIIFASIIYYQRFDLYYLFNVLLVPLFLYVIHRYKKNSLGFGDVELVFALSFSLSIYEQNLMLLMACIGALIFMLLFKSLKCSGIYFIPFISLAYFIIKIKEISSLIFLI